MAIRFLFCIDALLGLNRFEDEESAKNTHTHTLVPWFRFWVVFDGEMRTKKKCISSKTCDTCDTKRFVSGDNFFCVTCVKCFWRNTHFAICKMSVDFNDSAVERQKATTIHNSYHSRKRKDT